MENRERLTRKVEDIRVEIFNVPNELRCRANGIMILREEGNGEREGCRAMP